jgi:dihydrofolate reductase
VARLIYSAIASLDGYIEDEDGKFDWAEPDEEVHAFVNELERPVGTYLLARRMYEVMAYWETLALADQPPVIRDFAQIWRAADKIVYSKTLETAATARTRIGRDFDPESVRRMKAEAGRDLLVAVPISPPRRSRRI